MPGRAAGMTLMELMIALALVALLGVMAVPAFVSYVERARTSRAVGEIGTASIEIYKWRTQNGGFPETLADANVDMPPDPWGRAYRYTNIATAAPNEVRRDRNLRPVNTDFDLYSVGPDGETTMQFVAENARDDVVRANNGGYIGLAEDYY